MGCEESSVDRIEYLGQISSFIDKHVDAKPSEPVLHRFELKVGKCDTLQLSHQTEVGLYAVLFAFENPASVDRVGELQPGHFNYRMLQFDHSNEVEQAYISKGLIQTTAVELRDPIAERFAAEIYEPKDAALDVFISYFLRDMKKALR